MKLSRGLAAATVVAGADCLLRASHPPLVVAGALDESAHASTTILILAALGRPLGSQFAAGAVAASVAIDLDHLPQYLGSDFLTAQTPRPSPHSCTTLASVAVLALALRGRARAIAWGAELGLLGHFFRDMAVPSAQGGIALFWPVSYVNVHVPYFAYGLGLSGALLATYARTRSLHRRGLTPGA